MALSNLDNQVPKYPSSDDSEANTYINARKKFKASGDKKNINKLDEAEVTKMYRNSDLDNPPEMTGEERDKKNRMGSLMQTDRLIEGSDERHDQLENLKKMNKRYK